MLIIIGAIVVVGILWFLFSGATVSTVTATGTSSGTGTKTGSGTGTGTGMNAGASNIVKNILKITKATYGKNQDARCGTSTNPNPTANCGNRDRTSYIQSLIKSSTPTKLNDKFNYTVMHKLSDGTAMGGDPVGGVMKDLEIKYTCGDGPEKTFLYNKEEAGFDAPIDIDCDLP
jgi:hypothetical protein